MRRIEINCMTGESVVIPRAAYKDAQGNVFILDVGASTEGLTELTESELLAYSAPPPLTKDEQIAVILATQGRGRDRTTIQMAIQLAELIATLQAPSYGMTVPQAIAYAYDHNKTYRESKDTEAACRVVDLAP